MMQYRNTLVRTILVAATLFVIPAAMAAQSAASLDPGRFQATRAQLEELLARYDDAAASAAYSGELRLRARQEASLIRTRLAEGDFRVGDRIALTVHGEPLFTDTFAVAAGSVILLPLIGEISLDGVLRSELEAHLLEQIGRSVREPEVRARSLLRISVTGEVGRPGFYVIPAETPVTDVLMMVGGTGRDANLKAIRVERAGDRIWEGTAMHEAVIQGRTLDQLSLRAGDEIVVPRQRDRNPWRYVQALSTVGSLVLLALRIF